MNKFYIFLNIFIIALATGFAAVNPPAGAVSPNFSDVTVEGELKTDTISSDDAADGLTRIENGIVVSGQVGAQSVGAAEAEFGQLNVFGALTADTVGSFKTFRMDLHSGTFYRACPANTQMVSCGGSTLYPTKYEFQGAQIIYYNNTELRCKSKIRLKAGQAAVSLNLNTNYMTYTCFDPSGGFNEPYANLTE